MMYFDHGADRYHLRHNNDDDSRSVVKCLDFDFTVLLRFDSSLNVLNGAGERVGRLTTNRADVWTLVRPDDSVVELNIPCRDYHWQAITLAEIAASRVLLEVAP